MKKINKSAVIAVIIGLFISTSVLSQENTYQIVNNKNLTNISEYEAAMNKANFDSYRYLNSRRTITFNTGVVIELLSVSELQALNIPVDASKAKAPNLAPQYIEPIYKLDPNGYILMEIQIQEKK